MSELFWTPNPMHRYSIHAGGDYSVCKVGSASGFTYECWKGREQLKVGLKSADAAKAWCQRHHDEQQQLERSNADDQPPSLLAGQ